MTIRTARADELPMILDWAAAEGWNPGRDDAAAFMAADPEGFFVNEVDGKPVAAISVVNHCDALAFLGLYLCLPDYRGQGHGWAVWQAALEHAAGRTVGLDGVPAQQENYARSGFVKMGRTVRFAAEAMPRTQEGVGPGDPAALEALDEAVNGAARPRFATAWFSDTEHRRTLTAGPDTLVTIRRCGTGAKIGPLIAPDAATALRLVEAAAASLGETEIFVDIPDANPAGAELAALLNAAPVFETARMYRGTPPATDHARLFGIATMELG
ncbi:GNAT family N-acetyltransferase [Pontivivens ytuae]|uniref:GNAT family N-acetyltransferase n=1 Tax=Pontivivens ytuae TaxID=2789856 RepID=A0A7S9LSU1_9RHOB|nr:GNAT family N-acetyltransferase [Pontivivens ytuae]QPH54045.1 GNAT family N-acetyltransferase [Pontivivens ytuae]